MSERDKALQAELMGAIRGLADAKSRASDQAGRCPTCDRPETLRMMQAEAEVLKRAHVIADDEQTT